MEGQIVAMVGASLYHLLLMLLTSTCISAIKGQLYHPLSSAQRFALLCGVDNTILVAAVKRSVQAVYG